jgi:alkaline phosphatase
MEQLLTSPLNSTDSAAGATAFSCGMKSYNGAISMLPDHTPCGTVLEAAKKAGYMTGLVVTTDITDATPACFASHVKIRLEEDLIAQQEVGEHPLGRVVDLMLGGGRCHFLSNTTDGSCRGDDRDITKLAQDKYGWTYIDSREEFDGLELGKAVKLPLLGLFAGSDFPFEIDRRNMDDLYPSLDEMTRTALNALEVATQDNDKGFFLMIEGSRIDHAGHGNDPAAQVHEVLAYNRAMASVVEFLDRSEVEGVFVATSDHETGGLSIAKRMSQILSCVEEVGLTSLELHPQYPQYKWFPEVLANATHSSEHLARQLNSHISQGAQGDDLKQYITELVQSGLGIQDASDGEIQLLVDQPLLSVYVFADMISRRAVSLVLILVPFTSPAGAKSLEAVLRAFSTLLSFC